MPARINPRKVEQFLKRLDAGTLTPEDRAQLKKMIEEAVRLGIVTIVPPQTDRE